LPKRVNSVTVAENEEVLVACDDGCAYFLWRDGDLITKFCTKNPMLSAVHKGSTFFAGSKDGTVYVFEANGEQKAEVKTNRFAEVLLPLDEESFVGCSDACVKFDLSGKRYWLYDVGHVGKNLSETKEKILIPDLIWRKVHAVDPETGEGEAALSFKEKVYSVDCKNDKVIVGTTKEVILIENGKEVWSKDVGSQMTLVKFVSDYIVATNFVSKRLVVLDLEGNEILELQLEAKPTALDATGRFVVVGFHDGTVKFFELEGVEKEEAEVQEESKEEAEETEEVSEEVEAKVQSAIEGSGVEQLKEIAEGSYMGTPLAKEILEEMNDIMESVEGAKNIDELITTVLAKVEKLTNESTGDWKQAYANYEEAERLLEEILSVIKSLRERIGDVESCPPPEELIEILKCKNPREFTKKLAELAPEGTKISEKVKTGVKILKKCLERYYLLPSSEEVEKVEKKLEEVKQEKEALRALIESGI